MSGQPPSRRGQHGGLTAVPGAGLQQPSPPQGGATVTAAARPHGRQPMGARRARSRLGSFRAVPSRPTLRDAFGARRRGACRCGAAGPWRATSTCGTTWGTRGNSGTSSWSSSSGPTVSGPGGGGRGGSSGAACSGARRP